MENIIISIISAVATIGAVILTNWAQNREIQHKIETQQAVFETKLDNLTTQLNKQSERIDQHNHLNERLIAVEVRLDAMEGAEK